MVYLEHSFPFLGFVLFPVTRAQHKLMQHAGGKHFQEKLSQRIQTNVYTIKWALCTFRINDSIMIILP